MSDTGFPQNSNKKSRVKAPRRIGKYELQKRLGAGGMGAVFLAVDQRTKRSVALKVLPKDKASNEILVKRFQSEAHAAANLEHEHIVRVYEADEADGYLYIALEYIEGTDVDQILRKRERMPVKRAADIIKQVTLALAHAHEQGIIHRDIKPSNIMIRTDGVVKLTDLGLARSIDETDDTNITRAGTTVGTVDYMAPEQARNSRLADIRSDLYSLGCTWYQMIVGHPPYHEGSLTNKLQAHSSAKIPDPRDENPDVPEATVIMIQQLMAKKPEDRYQTPHELLDDFANSSLHREAISDDVLTALASSELTGEISSDMIPTTAPGDLDEAPRRSKRKKKTKNRSAAASNTTTSGPGGQKSLPPRTDAPPSAATSQKSARDDDSEKESLLASDAVKYIAVAGAFIGLFIGIWYVLSAFASGIDPGGTIPVGESQRKTARDMMGQNSGPPPVLPSNQEDGNESQPQQVTFEDSSKTPTKSSEAVSAVLLTAPHANIKPPHWAQQVPTADEVEELLPQWELKPRTVGRWQNRVGAYPHLDAAFSDLPAGNIWVQLIGPGPFLMSPKSFVGRNVVISAETSDIEPCIVFLSSSESPPSEFLSIKEGTLLLAGVNLTVDSQHFPTSGDASLVGVAKGDLLLRDVSLTMYGQRSAPTFALTQTSSTPRNRQHTLIDRTVIRGNWTAVRQSQSNYSALITNSLLITTEAPVVKVDAKAKNENQRGDMRSLDVVSSTLVSSHSAILAEAAEDPVRLSVKLDSSKIIHATDSDVPLARLKDWPVHQSSSSDQSAAQNFRWTTNSSEFVGWKSLVTASNQLSSSVENENHWRTFWADDFSNSSSSSESWSVPEALNAAPLNVTLWTSDTGSAGCPSNLIQVPNPDQQITAQAISSLQQRKPSIFEKPPSATIELNLDKTNLDTELKKNSWKDGTRFLLSGSKSDEISSVTVDGRSFTLEVAPDQPAEFEITSRSNQKDALLTVRNASLQLKNLKLRIPNRSPNSAQPTWLLNVSNGSLLLNNSSLTGPYIENKRHLGLVRWETGTGRSLPDSCPKRHLLELESSYLRTRGVAVSLAPQSGRVRLSNSIVAAQGVAFDCELSSDLNQSASLFDLKHSTFAASEAIWKISSPPDIDSGIRAQFLVRECISLNIAPVVKRTRKMAYLIAEPEWIDRPHLLWWGRGNGYATSIECFTKGPDEPGESQTIDRWISLWGGLNVQKPLYSPDGVLLSEADRIPEEIPVEFFILDERARSLTWNSEGGPIGADPQSFSFLAASAEEAPTEKKPSRPRSTSGF